jgi:hypothetical protein
MAEPIDFREAWDHTEVRVVSPNEQVFITVRGNREVEVGVDPGYYGRATRDQLETQLARAARLAFIERTRAFLDLRGRERGEPLKQGRTIHSREDTEYFRRLDELAVEGESDDGQARVSAVGMTHFTVSIAPSVLERLDPAEFCRIASQAATRLLEDQLRKGKELRYDVYMRPLVERHLA